VTALSKVHEVMPNVEIVLFGEDLDGLELPFPYRAEGLVTDHEHLAHLYSSARIHLDASDFQAFGLPGLEAMACGTVSVLSDAGGVREYARDEENCLLVPPGDADRIAQAVLRLLDDDALRLRLRQGGLTTSRNHSMRRAARMARAVLEAIARSDVDDPPASRPTGSALDEETA
jgi:glycosyltransferase involved in cell wall biosynthesis